MQDGMEIRRVDAFVYRFPCPRPVSTSFGIMADRPAVFVRLEDDRGTFGWGEIFANWPAAGAEHRANLLMQDIADLVLGARLFKPDDLFRKLDSLTHLRAIQCGEQGPFRQVIAGLDIAAWDMFARAAGTPLNLYLNPAAAPSVPVYASGIHVRDGEEHISASRTKGISQFKVKVGFDFETDVLQVNALSGGLTPGEKLMADANQAWDLETALTFVARVQNSGLCWLEEPIPVDSTVNEWTTLAANSAIPLAGGENIAGNPDFVSVIGLGALTVLQPDVAKWGGVTGCFEVARNALAAGRRYCPHFLGGGIGLYASAHLLAATGGDGVLEVDVNANPLRDAIADSSNIENGKWQLMQSPGLGVEYLPGEIEPYQTLALSRSA